MSHFFLMYVIFFTKNINREGKYVGEHKKTIERAKLERLESNVNFQKQPPEVLFKKTYP